MLSVSPDDPRRSRLLPRGALAGLGGVCLVVLAIVFPGEGLVRLIERTSNHALAIDYLQNLLRLHPGDSRLLTLLAQRYLAIGEAARAWQVLEQATGPEAQALRERVAVASWRAARDAGQADEAALWHTRVLERTLARRPASAREWIEALELLHELGAFDRAAPWLAEAGSRGRASPGEAEELARRLLALAQPRAAAELLTQAAQASRGLRQRQLWRAAASAWLGAGEPVLALRTARALGASRPVDTADAWLLARLAVSAGQPVDAARWLRLALGMEADGRLEGTARLDTRGLDEAWRIFTAAGDLDGALQVSALAHRIDPASTTWAERHARVLEWAGRPQEALPLWVRLMRGPLARQAQARVQALAPGLFDGDAMIAYWRTRAATGPLSPADWTAYISLLRQQGRVPEAIEVTRQAARRHPVLLRLLAPLLWSEGRVDEALAAYVEAARRGLLDAAARLEGAGAMLAAVRLDDAARLLAPDPEPGTAPDVREDYLELRADLAWELGDDRQALRDYVALYALNGQSAEGMVEFRAQRLLALTRRLDGPAAALRLAPSLWAHTPSAGLAELWLDVIAQQPGAGPLREWERALATSAVGAQVQRRGAVVQRQAGLWRVLGRSDLALPLLRRARALAPQNVPILMDWVSLLVEQRQWEELRQTLARDAGRLERDPEGSLVLAEAARELGHPAWALRLMRAQYARRERDPLWLAGYADLLEQVGQRAQAERVRQRAWELLPRGRAAAAAATPEAATQELARLLLQLRLAPGRSTEAEQQALVRGLRERLRAGGLDAAAQAQADATIVNWLLALELDSWADWWLARRVVAGSIGAGQRALRGIVHGDRETVREHLPAGNASLNPEDRAEALWLTGERQAALAEFGQVLERAAARDDNPERLRDIATVTAERQRERAHHLQLGAQDERLGRLDLRQVQTTAHLALGERWAVQVQGTQERAAQRTGSTLGPLPSGQTIASVTARWRDERLELAAGWQHHGLGERSTAWQLEARYRLTDAHRLSVQAAHEAPALDTDLLRVAGRRDHLTVQWDGSHGRLYATAAATAARYRTETGGALGRTAELRAQAGYWLRRSEPVLAVRSFASWRRERADDTPRPELSRWVATGEALSGEQVLPGSQGEYGVALRWGLADGLPSRRWWPHVELTLAGSTRTGFTPAASIAWRGPLVGADELELSLQRSQSDTGPGQQLRLQYRRWFDR